MSQVPPNLELKALIQTQNRQVFQVYHKGYPVRGMQVSAVQSNGNVIISSSVNSDCSFQGNIAAGLRAMWVENEIPGTYKLEQYKDSQGIRTWSGGEMIEDLHRYNHSDTWVNGWVFLPDPLSSANKLYGGIYTDRGDSSYAEIEAQQMERRIALVFENDSFRLKNRWISFAEISPPVTPHAVTQGEMKYRRNEPQFEEVNVFWHVQSLSQWWDSLGFSDYRDTVVIDAHAFGGADESAFDPTQSPPTIEFGDGGVDDAEDADAAVHEYTHAAFNSVIPDAYFGTERQAVEEGICDFMAVCYSARYTQNQPGVVYNWDGHNQFWAGRALMNNRTYPQHITGQPHIDGQLFGAALFDFSAEVGADSAVNLVMHALPLMVSGMNMRNAARLLVFTDSVINSGRNRWPLIKAFYPRGLLPNVGVHDLPVQTVLLRNTMSFARGNGPMVLQALDSASIEIHTAEGKLIKSFSLQPGDTGYLQPSDYRPGVYIISSGGWGVKFVRF